MQNREYQSNHIEKIVTEVSFYRTVLAQLPTGGGKTVEFSLITQRYTRNTDKSVLILVHREELMYQAAETIERIVGVKPYLITSKTKKYYLSRVYIGMVESTISRTNMFDNVGLIIIDECHINNFIKIHSIFLEEKIIGFSATPKSSGKLEPLNKYYRSIVVGPQINELISMGFLAQNITRCPKDIVDAAKLEVDKLKGDYNEAKMATEYKKPKYITNTVSMYNRFCRGKKTIIFNVNVEHSKEVTECFNFCGYNARHLDANSKDRAEILKWFKNTEDAILCNVMIATVGFDEPTIENVILNFSTLSLVKFIQCCGRGGRKLPMKEYFNIIDMGGNCIKFGDWNDNRDWEYIFANPDLPGDGVAPVKICPECEGLVHASARVCTMKKEDGELCLYEFEKKKTAEEQDLEEVILITKGINVDELIYKHQKKYEYYTFLEMADPILNKLYENYHEPPETLLSRAFEEYYKLCIDWYSKTLANKGSNIRDITHSAFHIKLAKNNFNELIKKYTKLNETNKLYCENCNSKTEPITCDCGKKVCKNCIYNEGFCKDCQEINLSHVRSIRGY